MKKVYWVVVIGNGDPYCENRKPLTETEADNLAQACREEGLTVMVKRDSLARRK
jgi:hypothetical protein